MIKMFRDCLAEGLKKSYNEVDVDWYMTRVFKYDPGQPRDRRGRWTDGKSSDDIIKPLANSNRKQYNNLLLNKKTTTGVRIRRISEHCFERIAQRRISPEDILNALTHPVSISDGNEQYGTVLKEYRGDRLRVVLNEQDGVLVTVIPVHSSKRTYGGE